MKTKLSLSLLMLSSVAFADINMKDAAFTTSHNEFPNPLLEKKYSSRSLWQGAFGFGWCTRFETRLKVFSGRKSLLQRCDRRIMVAVVKKENQYIYNSPSGEEVYDADGRLTGHTPSRSRLFYDSQGRLSRIDSPEGSYFFTYQSAQNLIEKVSPPASAAATYSYERGNLQVIKKGPLQVRFEYDDFHNLTSVQSPQSFEKITYRTEKDEVLTYESSATGCRSTFEFRKLNATGLQSAVERTCGSRSTRQSWIFKARRTSQGRLILDHVQITGDLNERQALP